MRLQATQKENVQDISEIVETPGVRLLPSGIWPMFGFGLLLSILLGAVALVLAPLPILVIMGSLTVALLLGLAWRAVFGLPKTSTGGVRFASQKLLRWGIILTGVRLNFALVASSGLKVLALDVILMAVGIFALPWLARQLGLTKNLAFLIGVGQSICGASAVGAMAALLPDGEEDDTSLAVALCGLLGTIGVLLFTFGAHVMGLSGTFYGLLAGSTLHEIAQVVAAGPAGGAGAADVAMVTKLTRVMLLAPVAMGVALVVSLRKGKQVGSGERHFHWKKVSMPWFVFGFLAVGAANSLGLMPKNVSGILLQVSVFLMVVAMAAMGLLVDLQVLRQSGLKALSVSLLLFVLFVTLSSGLVALLH